MVKNDEGLTKTYNRFHDPDETSPDIHRLRELHATMDRAVLDAYGWTDIPTDCEFLLDYEDDEDEDDAAPARRRRKKPWRYRWPDEIRDEVLARLLELNKQRAEQERLAGEESSKPRRQKERSKPAKSAKTGRSRKAPATANLLQKDIDRCRNYVLLLLRAWDGKALTRRALNAGMRLMLDDKLRNALLHRSTMTRRSNSADVELNHVITELRVDGFIEIDNSKAQQIVRITKAAPLEFDVDQEDVDRINAVKEYFRREAESGKVVEHEEEIDADLDLAFAGQ